MSDFKKGGENRIREGGGIRKKGILAKIKLIFKKK